MNQNRIYMNVTITLYGANTEPFCRFYECVDGGEMTSRKLGLNEALKLAWELQLAGGKRTVRPHPYCNTINYIDVDFWARH